MKSELNEKHATPEHAAWEKQMADLSAHIGLTALIGDFEVAFSGSCHAGMPGVGQPYFGCHQTFMSGIRVSVDWAKTKRVKGDTAKTQWGSLSQKDRDEINKLLATGGPNGTAWRLEEKHYEGFFKDLVARYASRGPGVQDSRVDGYVPRIGPHGITYVLMGDNINAYTPDFPKYSGIPSSSVVPGLKTSTFAEWLMKYNIGVVIQAPIGRNQYHQTEGNFSCTCAWIWIPPGQAQYLMPGTFKITGLDHLPTKERWIEQVEHSLPHLRGSTKDESAKKIGKALFHEGKIPWV